MNTEPVKTYFVTDKFENKFPADFISSRNKKYIVVQDCKCIIDGSMPSDVELHADFIKRDAYCDHFVMFCNDTALKKYKKYEYDSHDTTFKIWFTDLDGKEFKPNKKWVGEEGILQECEPYDVIDDEGHYVYMKDHLGNVMLDENGNKIKLQSNLKLVRNQWIDIEGEGLKNITFKLQMLLIY